MIWLDKYMIPVNLVFLKAQVLILEVWSSHGLVRIAFHVALQAAAVLSQIFVDGGRRNRQTDTAPDGTPCQKQCQKFRICLVQALVLLQLTRCPAPPAPVAH